MKPVLFIICFALGVSLMVFSGYLPQSASARGTLEVAGPTEADAAKHSFGRTVTRRAADPEFPDGSFDLALDADDATDVYTPTDGEVAAKSRLSESGAPPPFPDDPPPVPKPAVCNAAAGGAGDIEAPATASPADPPDDAEQWPVFADAGSDRVLWIGWNEFKLDGGASLGQGLSFEWRQKLGPVDLVIANEHAAVTLASGLLGVEKLSWRESVYEFELTVTDAEGERDSDTVRYLVQAGPALTIKPRAKRRFELRDGYELGHYGASITNLETYESMFEISSETELTFTKVTGSAYALTGGPADGKYVYQVVVYGREGDANSWVEFLIDTADRVPGIVQLGVNWESQ